MAQTTSIEWTDATWNPVHGCSKVSPGCAHCYAETLSRRYNQTPKPWTPANAAENVLLKPHKLREPLKWKDPRMIFVNSMSDLFHELVPDDYIAQVLDVMVQAHWHTFQVLTKRPERMRDVVTRYWQRTGAWGDADVAANIWLGTSIENRRFVGRADVLRQTPAAVRFISAEPLLGPLLPDADHMVDSEHETYPVGDAPVYAWREWADGYTGPGLSLEQIDWLIVGGESGAGHRPIRVEWVRALRDYCQEECWQGEREGHTAFFFKQWGGARPKSSGRTLDFRTWDEMPTAATA